MTENLFPIVFVAIPIAVAAIIIAVRYRWQLVDQEYALPLIEIRAVDNQYFGAGCDIPGCDNPANITTYQAGPGRPSSLCFDHMMDMARLRRQVDQP